LACPAGGGHCNIQTGVADKFGWEEFLQWRFAVALKKRSKRFRIDATVNLRANFTTMTDTERINALENDIGQIKAELNRLTLALNSLASRAERTRASTQEAINGVQHDIELIFTNVNVPNVVFYPDKRSTID
jgi:hypothetical protein